MSITEEDNKAFDKWWTHQKRNVLDRPREEYAYDAYTFGVEQERARWEKKLAAIEIKSKVARNKVEYDDLVYNMYVDVSPSERIYFSSMTVSDWASDGENEAAAAERKKEIKAALKNLLENME